ncbi:MAG TPA: hypothetical protein VFD92_06815 [Candidatus Binatia bacterium]|nr:hypothetical protein [Candidatus Binatia bacterium]
MPDSEDRQSLPVAKIVAWAGPAGDPVDAVPADVWAFCERVLSDRQHFGKETVVSEIDVGSRWDAETGLAKRDRWTFVEQRYRHLTDGDLEPIGYSFEVMIRDQYLLRIDRAGNYLCVKRRRGVLVPMAIADSPGAR